MDGNATIPIRGGNGSKPITEDAMRAEMLQNCAQCARIGEIKTDIQTMRANINTRMDHIDDSIGAVHSRIDILLQNLAKG